LTAEPDNTTPDSDGAADPLQILMQTSAAAEALQQQFNELKSRRSELIGEQNQLAAERSAFESRAQKFAEHVARERQAQRELTADMDSRLERIQSKESEQEQLEESLQKREVSLEERQQKLHEVVDQEMARERGILQRHRETVDAERDRLAARSDELEKQHAARMRQIEEQLETERNGMRETIRAEMSEELAQLAEERREWDDDRARQQAELKEQEEDLQQQRELFGEQLDAEHKRLREEIEKRRQQLLTEQNNLQRRYRFQFEHLARAREDFEEEVRELRHEQQLFRSQRTSFSEQHQLRFTQLRQIRSALFEKEESLAREYKVVDRYRISMELDLKRQQGRMDEQNSSVSQDLDSRARQIRQAEESAAETAARVEQRLQHVNAMRAELDARQQEVLEQRLLLQEMMAAGAEEIARREQSPALRQARLAVEAFFQQLRGPLQSERERLSEQAAALSERQEQFRRDRAELESWFADQEQKLSTQSCDPSEDAQTQITELQARIDRMKAEVTQERKDSELRIRQLTDKLATETSRQFRQVPTSSDDEQKAAA